jgi:hypothetical protein
MSQSLGRIRQLITEIDRLPKGELGPEAMSPEVLGSPPAFLPNPEKPHSVIKVELEGDACLEVVANGEKLELRSTDQGIHIEFEDGKAFHIPKKNVA